jgi:hypothetical protein
MASVPLEVTLSEWGDSPQWNCDQYAQLWDDQYLAFQAHQISTMFFSTRRSPSHETLTSDPNRKYQILQGTYKKFLQKLSWDFFLKDIDRITKQG